MVNLRICRYVTWVVPAKRMAAIQVRSASLHCTILGLVPEILLPDSTFVGEGPRDQRSPHDRHHHIPTIRSHHG